MTTLPEALLDVGQVAEILGVRERWIYEHKDDIPHVRVGRYIRFTPQAVRSFIEDNTAIDNGGGDGAGA